MLSSKRRTGIAVACAALVSMAVPAGSMAAVKVDLRVEGASETLYEKRVEVGPLELESTGDPDSGRHPCNVAGNGGRGKPAGTPTGALAAARLTTTLEWDPGFSDFFVQAIAGQTPALPLYWGLYVNGKASEVGGCQVRLRRGDSVVWAVADGSESLLVLRSLGRARDRRVTLKATSGSTGRPVPGASVAGKLTGADGRVRVSRPSRGVQRFQATANGYIRSNTVAVARRR